MVALVIDSMAKFGLWKHCKHAAGSTKEPDLFSVYVRLWSTNRLFFTFMYPTTDALALLPLVLVAFVTTSFPFCLITHFGSICMVAWHAPFVLTSDIWSLMMDFTVVLSMVLFWKAERNALITECAKVIVPQLGIFYFAAGFWKFNTSHLDHRSSCSTIMIMSLLDRFMPEGEIPLWLLNVAAHGAGHLGVLLESSIGVFLLLPGICPRIGALLSIALHAFIALNPTPNNASVFGAKMTLPRFFFVAPVGCAEVLKEISTIASEHDRALHKGIIAIVAILAFAIFIGVQNGSGELGPSVVYDLFVPWNTLQMIFLGRALWLDTKRDLWENSSKKVEHVERSLPEEPSREEKVAFRQHRLIEEKKVPEEFEKQDVYAFGKAHHAPVLLWTLFYAFGTLILGCQQMGTAAGPFSNLRIHGGSNHLVLPTGLLQEWSVGPYAGGVVRIDGTNSSFLRKLYPHEITHNLSPRARGMMQKVGHSGREWMPLFSRTAGPYLPFSDMGRVPFIPYTVPALELRRLVLELRKNNEACFLHYSKLPKSGKLDSVKSQAQVADQIQLLIDAQGILTCSRRIGNASEPCASEELALLPAPSWWVLKFHIGYPIPLPNDYPEAVCAT